MFSVRDKTRREIVVLSDSAAPLLHHDIADMMEKIVERINRNGTVKYDVVRKRYTEINNSDIFAVPYTVSGNGRGTAGRIQ